MGFERLDWRHKLTDFHTKGDRKLQQLQDADVALSPLERTVVGTIDSDIECECVLGAMTLGQPHFAQAFADKDERLRAALAAFGRLGSRLGALFVVFLCHASKLEASGSTNHGRDYHGRDCSFAFFPLCLLDDVRRAQGSRLPNQRPRPSIWGRLLFTLFGQALNQVNGTMEEMMPKENADASVEALRAENERLKSDLRYFEKRYRLLEALINSAPLVIYIKNGKREYSFFNPTRQRQLNLKPDEILWHNDLDLVGNLWGILAHEHDGKVLASGEAVEALESAPHGEEQQRHWLVVRFPFAGPEGEDCIGAVGVNASQLLPPSDRLPP